MANDEPPKDYSSLYCEDPIKPPLPPMRRSTNSGGANTMIHPRHNHGPHVAYRHHQQQASEKNLDGNKPQKRPCESSVDLRAVAAKLQNLTQEKGRYAMDTLSKHYSSVFVNRRNLDHHAKPIFKAYIQYFDEKDTYVVRVDRNTLRAVKDKLPKRGDYRFFFKQLDNTCEEVESEESIVPFHEKGGSRLIYCQVFPF